MHSSMASLLLGRHRSSQGPEKGQSDAIRLWSTLLLDLDILLAYFQSLMEDCGHYLRDGQHFNEVSHFSDADRPTSEKCRPPVLLLEMSDSVTCANLGTELKEVAEGNGQFAFQLFKAVRSASPVGNLIISPFNITTCLALCYAGSRSNTADQMREVMQLPKNDDTIHKAFKAIMSSFRSEKPSDGLTINVANRIYVDQTLAVKDAYLSALSEFFEAEIGKSDFANNPDAERILINKWVQEVTKDKIENLLPPETVQSYSRAVLVSAIYFKGDWKTKFDPEFTREGRFQLDKKRTVTVPMMFSDSEFPYTLNSKLKYKLLELPYVGDRFSMLVLLPDDREGLAAIEDALSIEDLRTSIASLCSEDVEVTLPKFKVEHTTDLKAVLQSMGIADLFSGIADLSGISGESLYVGTAVHKAFLEVNEEGSEAAAASGLGFDGPGPIQPKFRADHPFLVLIYDKRTGMILFMGRISDPKK